MTRYRVEVVDDSVLKTTIDAPPEVDAMTHEQRREWLTEAALLKADDGEACFESDGGSTEYWMDDESPGELTGDDIPFHLRLDVPANGHCQRCLRQTWSADGLDIECRMTQPDGSPCGGRLVPHGGDSSGER